MIALLAAAEALVVVESRARALVAPGAHPYSTRALFNFVAHPCSKRNRPPRVCAEDGPPDGPPTRAEVADLAADLLSSAVAQDSASEALSEASSELDALMETWAEDLGLKSTEELEEWIEDFESDEEVSDFSIDGPGTLD